MRTGRKADIALRFIDTESDGGSIFVPPADFLGANEPYEKKLRKGVRA